MSVSEPQYSVGLGGMAHFLKVDTFGIEYKVIKAKSVHSHQPTGILGPSYVIVLNCVFVCIESKCTCTGK